LPAVGSSYIRYGADEARVTINFSDGTEVCRIKGKTRNAITIKNSDGNIEAFEKIGRDLPQEAINALGNPPIDKIHGPISYSEQMAPYFLVSLSSTEMPRSISELTGIEDFELAAQMLGKKWRQADTQAKESAKRIEKFESDLMQYDDLDSQLANLVLLEEKSNNVKKINNTINELTAIMDKYDTIMVNGRKINLKLKRAKAIAKAENKLIMVREIKKQIELVSNTLSSYQTNVRNENRAKAKIKQLKSISSVHILDKVEKANNITAEIKDINNLIKQLIELQNKRQRFQIECDKWNKKLQEKQNKYDEITRTMKEQGLWCDVCDRPLAIDDCNKE
jgi:DNA repair exonuclease SbcCD ATPase subunit